MFLYVLEFQYHVDVPGEKIIHRDGFLLVSRLNIKLS